MDGQESLGHETPEQTDAAQVADGAEALAPTETDGTTPSGDEAVEQVEEEAAGDETTLPKGLTPEAQAAVNKRIGHYAGKAREASEKLAKAETELADLRKQAERVNELASDKHLLGAAESAGVLPELLDAKASKAIAEYQEALGAEEAFQAWLEENTDGDAQMAVGGGKMLSRTEAVQMRRNWHARRMALEKPATETMAEVRKRSRELWQLGLAAQKAGWKPGAAPAKAGAAAPVKPGATIKPGELVKPQTPAKPRPTGPAAAASPRATEGAAAPEVWSHDDLVSFIRKTQGSARPRV